MNVSYRNDIGFMAAMRHKAPSLKQVVWVMAVALSFAGSMTSTVRAEMDEQPKNEQEKREKLYSVRIQLIQKLEEFKRTHPEYMRRAEYKHRLGENYYEVAKFYEFQNRNTEAKAYMNKAIDLLEDVRKNDTGYADYAKVEFVLASAYMESQQQSKAGEVLADLSGKYPNSPVMKEASLMLGDYYFDKSQPAKAETYYKLALADTKMQSYLFYKLAWTNINQNRPQGALEYFEKVLNLRGSEAAASNDYSKEAGRELLWPALEIYKPEGIIAYLEKIKQDQETIEANLTSLSTGLMKKSEFAGAAKIYEQLAIKYPGSVRMNDWIGGQIKAEESMGRTQRIPELLARLKGAGKDSSSVEAQVLNSAKKFHAEAQKAKTPNEKVSRLNLAVGYYNAFLATADPAKPEVLQTKFYLAEALYAQEKFHDAAPFYEEVAKGTGPQAGQAAWNWFLTIEKLADGFRNNSKEFKAASAADEKYLEAARYIQTLPNISADQKRKATYQSARLLYQLNDHDRALPIFQALADGFGATAEGKLSAQLVLDIYNLRKDYKSVAQYAHAYQANADAGTKAELNQLESKASLKGLEQEERDAKSMSGDTRLVALEAVSRKFMSQVIANPRGEQNDQLLWASLQNFAEIALERHDATFDDVRSTFKTLMARFPNSAQAKKAVPFMGRFLGYRGGLTPETLKEFSGYRSQWKSLAHDEPADKRGRYIMMLYKMSSSASEKREFIQEAKGLPHNADNSEALAYVQLAKVEALAEKIDKISLDNAKTLGRSTAQRVNMLEQLQAEVTSLVKLKVAESAISGLKILGDANAEMASAIRTSPIPKGLGGADLQKYQGIVQNKAAEFDQRSNEAHRLAQEKASELGVSGATGI